MTFDSKLLVERLAALTAAEPASRWLVAFSGGVDSTVLLHALSSARDLTQAEVIGIHVNHGLHPDAAAWEKHCRAFAEKLGVTNLSRQVTVDSELKSGDVILELDGEAPESARNARRTIARAESDIAAQIMRNKSQRSVQIAPRSFMIGALPHGEHVKIIRIDKNGENVIVDTED